MKDNQKGKLIVIEGSSDGVGKTTQYNLLVDRLKSEYGENIVTHHFPSYGTYQGRAVEEYLKGNFGPISKLSPYFVNNLYAQDRAITWETGLRGEYEKGKIIILDRYATSSQIYQSASIENSSEREKFIDYVYDYEYNKIGIPVPDIVIFLYAPFDVIKSLRLKRKNNEGIKKDIHENDNIFLQKVHDNSLAIAKKYDWNFIECTKDGEMLSVDTIHEMVYNSVKEKVLKK